MRIGIDLWWIIQLDDERDVFGVRQRTCVAHGILYERTALHRLNVEREGLRLHPRQVEEILDQRLHPPRRPQHALEGRTQLRRALVAVLRQLVQQLTRFEHYYGERVLEVVG